MTENDKPQMQYGPQKGKRLLAAKTSKADDSCRRNWTVHVAAARRLRKIVICGLMSLAMFRARAGLSVLCDGWCPAVLAAFAMVGAQRS